MNVAPHRRRGRSQHGFNQHEKLFEAWPALRDYISVNNKWIGGFWKAVRACPKPRPRSGRRYEMAKESDASLQFCVFASRVDTGMQRSFTVLALPDCAG